MLVGGGRPEERTRRRLRLPRGVTARRTTALLGVYLLLIGAVGYRLVSVQVLDAERYASLGEKQRERTIELNARRGRIYDRNGDVLATSVDAATVYADPRAYRSRPGPDGLQVPPAGDAAEVAATLAPLLERDADEIERRLRKDAHFVYLARQLDRSLGERIEELALPGVGILTEPKRVYPNGPLSSHVLGFTGIDGDGLSGLEVQYDPLLAGDPGSLVLEQAPGGLSIASAGRQLTPPQPGTDLVLTVDREIQHVAETAAAAAVERHDAAGASVIVMDVGTGEILAMANAPSFDPNDLRTTDDALRRNRAVTDMFEPGSVQKAVTAAAVLEEGVAGPDTVYDVADTLQVGRKTFSDDHRHPTQPMTVAEIIEQSSNVGTIKLAHGLGADRLARYLDAFGYGEALGVGFPGESAGSFPPVDQWSNTSLPTIAIGYGVAVTLLQATSVYATIANDGVAVQPRMVRGTVAEDGRLTPSPPAATHRVIGAETARQLRRMLGLVVDGERGTGSRAAIPGYDVAGKTGTARKPLTDARGYSNDYIGSFVGFAPVDDPRLVVAVMIDDPSPIYGGLTAAPVFEEVMSFALSHRRVPPTRPHEARAIPAPEPEPLPVDATPAGDGGTAGDEEQAAAAPPTG